MAKRNIEDIRRKNLEENQLFLKKLRVDNIRNDFVDSARSFLRKKETKKEPAIHHEKVERVTRYSLKLKSGQIEPFIPQWQQKANKKKTCYPSKWTLFYMNNVNPYQRTFNPRHTKLDERIQQDLLQYSKK